MDWDDVRYFLTLARQGSVRAAGTTLQVSHSTVARRVEALEAELGVRLFDRHRDGYLLTDSGQQMIPGAERIEREMAALERTLVGKDARLEGSIRVTCTDPFIARMLVGSLAELCKQHSGLHLELDAESRNLDLSKREADLAVRAFATEATPPEHLIGHRLVPIVIASYVSVAHGDRLDPECEGSDARWLGSDRTRISQTLVSTSSYPNLPIWGVFASLSVMLEAARHGLGLVMLPTYVGDCDPGLRRLRRADLRHMGDFWLLSHPDLRDNARLRAAKACVTKELQSRTSLFEGTRPTHAPERPEDEPPS